MGVDFDLQSSRVGINPPQGGLLGAITDYKLSNCVIGGSSDTNEGQFRISDSVFQVFLTDRFRDVVVDFRFREDSNGRFELEHKPIGFNEFLEVMSGNSNLLGQNDLPLVQNYESSMGAFPFRLVVGGGTFN